MNHRAAGVIPLGCNPAATLTTPARVLRKRDQPVAFDGFGIREKVGVGRVGSLDDSNAAQKIDPAALSLIACSGPISR
jgi:hypothetical protein